MAYRWEIVKKGLWENMDWAFRYAKRQMFSSCIKMETIFTGSLIENTRFNFKKPKAILVNTIISCNYV